MNLSGPARIPYGRFAVLIALNVLALLAEKMAAIHSSGTGLIFYKHLVTQGWMWLGIGLGPLQLWVWTGILARTELSLAFPISSLCYPLTMVAAQLVFREQLGWEVWVGALLITLGVAIVSSTSVEREARTLPPMF